jgi:hypothetical protein
MKCSKHPFKYQFYDDWSDSLYRSEERSAKTISPLLFWQCNIPYWNTQLIFSSERRTKEIGMEK